MSQGRIILVGGGGHARSCVEAIESTGDWEIAGLIDPRLEKGEKVLCYPVLGGDEDLDAVAKEVDAALITIGQIKTARVRIRIYDKVVALGLQLPTIVASTARVSRHATVGEGTVVLHGVIVNANARVGKNCIVNSRALVEHDVVVEDHCHISTGAILNGEVHVEAGSFVGSGAVIRQCVRIGAGSVIGAGCTVMAAQPAGSLIKLND